MAPRLLQAILRYPRQEDFYGGPHDPDGRTPEADPGESPRKRARSPSSAHADPGLGDRRVDRQRPGGNDVRLRRALDRVPGERSRARGKPSSPGGHGRLHPERLDRRLLLDVPRRISQRRFLRTHFPSPFDPKDPAVQTRWIFLGFRAARRPSSHRSTSIVVMTPSMSPFCSSITKTRWISKAVSVWTTSSSV